MKMTRIDAVLKSFGGCVLVAVFFLGNGCSRTNSISKAYEPKSLTTESFNARKIGTVQEEVGIMSGDDYVRLYSITENIKASGKVSDLDLNWMLSVMRKPTKYPALVNSRILIDLTNLKKFTVTQKQKICAVTEPLLASHEPLDRDAASVTLRYLKDRHAIAKLRPLLHDPNEDVRIEAEKTLRSFGQVGI